MSAAVIITTNSRPQKTNKQTNKQTKKKQIAGLLHIPPPSYLGTPQPQSSNRTRHPSSADHVTQMCKVNSRHFPLSLRVPIPHTPHPPRFNILWGLSDLLGIHPMSSAACLAQMMRCHRLFLASTIIPSTTTTTIGMVTTNSINTMASTALSHPY